MSELQYTTVNRILGKVHRDLKGINLNENDAIEWIGEALEFLKVFEIQEQAIAFIEVKNYGADIPNGFQMVLQIARYNNGTPNESPYDCENLYSIRKKGFESFYKNSSQSEVKVSNQEDLVDVIYPHIISGLGHSAIMEADGTMESYPLRGRVIPGTYLIANWEWSIIGSPPDSDSENIYIENSDDQNAIFKIKRDVKNSGIYYLELMVCDEHDNYDDYEFEMNYLFTAPTTAVPTSTPVAPTPKPTTAPGQQYISWTTSSFYKQNFTPVRLANHTFFNSLVAKEKDDILYINNCQDEYTIVGTTDKEFRFSFKEGYIALSYIKNAVDKETGYPLIPENVSYITAITYYIKWKIAEMMNWNGREGYTRIAQDSERLWLKYARQAKSYMKMPKSIDDFQNLLEETHYLIPKHKRYYGYFGNLGREENRRFNDPNYRRKMKHYYYGKK